MTLLNTTGRLSPRIRDAIRGRFDEIHSLFDRAAANASGATASPRDQVDCLEKATALRISILDYVDFLHSDLRFRLSAATRINQLPDEILVHIMSNLSFHQLVNATHVCHRWRKLGVGTPALWTRLTITEALLDDLDVLLARSKAASLDLEISIHRGPTSLRNLQSWNPMLLSGPDLARVRSLAIWSFSFPMDRHDFNAIVLRQPAHGEEAPPLPLRPAPRLETLRIDSRRDNFSLSRTLSLDCSMLREAYIIRGVSGIGFLRACSLLRVLVLHVPTGVREIDVLRVVRANPTLRVLEMYIPSEWEVADGPPGDEDVSHAPITCELERLIVRTDSTDAFWQVAYCDILLAIISQFDHSRIPEVEISCCLDGAGGDVLGNLLLVDLHDVQSIVLRPNSLRLQDARGYSRGFTNVVASHQLEMALPFVGAVRSLELRLSQWSTLKATHGITELPSLEELTLSSGLRGFSSMQGGVACPALRNLTVVESSSRWARRDIDTGGDQPDFFNVAMAVPRERIPRCPPLQLLTIVRECDPGGTQPEDQTLHFDPPLPRTVFVTSAVSEMPRLLAESDDDLLVVDTVIEADPTPTPPSSNPQLPSP